MIYVDPIQDYTAVARQRGLRHTRWCHLLADTREELHEAARALGLRRAWFQDHAYRWHYDITPSKRALALRHGAVEIDRQAVAALMDRRRAALTRTVGPVLEQAAVRGLSIRQPWASCIAYADKRIENRTWLTGWRGPLLIHAARTVDRQALRHPPVATAVRGHPMELGAVIAVARLTGCHEADGRCTPWSADAQHHLELADVHPLALPIPWKGLLGLWVPPADLLERVRQQLPEGWGSTAASGEDGAC